MSCDKTAAGLSAYEESFRATKCGREAALNIRGETPKRRLPALELAMFGWKPIWSASIIPTSFADHANYRIITNRPEEGSAIVSIGERWDEWWNDRQCDSFESNGPRWDCSQPFVQLWRPEARRGKGRGREMRAGAKKSRPWVGRHDLRPPLLASAQLP